MCRAATIHDNHRWVSLRNHQYGWPGHETFARAATTKYPFVVHVQDELQFLSFVERQMSVVGWQPVWKGPHVTNGLPPTGRRRRRPLR